MEEKIKSWSIQDAKTGDILVCGDDKRPFIFKGLLDRFHPKCPVAYCGIDTEGTFLVNTSDVWWTDDEVQPATEEQSDFLFKTMRDAGYKWDAEKKELIQITK